MTVRTLSEILDLLPDNTAGLITPARLRDFADSAMPTMTDIRAHGAVAGTDSTAAIQAALDAAGGSGVFVPPGTWLHTGLTIPSNTRLVGGGRGLAVLKLADGANAHAIQNADTVNGNSGLEFRSLTFDFNGANQASDSHGIRFERVADFLMEGCDLKDAYHHNLVSIAPAAGSNSRWNIIGTHSANAGQGAGIDGDGFRVADGFTGDEGAVLVNCTTVGVSHHGIHLGANCTATNCHARAAGTANFYLAGSGARADGCTGRVPTTTNLLINAADCGVSGGLYDASGDSSSDVIRIQSGGTGSIIDGVRVMNGLRYGIHVQANNCSLTGNIVSDHAADGVIITANRVNLLGGISHTNGNDGVEISGSPDRVSVVGVKIFGNTNAGIRVAAGATNLYVDANDINQATQIFGTPTSGIVRNGIASAIADLAQDVSATYVEAEVQAISDKVDAILAALRSSGIIAS